MIGVIGIRVGSYHAHQQQEILGFGAPRSSGAYVAERRTLQLQWH
jgi:hypothetical protein